MSDIIGGRYEVRELLAVGWDDDMAARFPNADHHGCRCQFTDAGKVIRCCGWHCNRCGKATNSFGHHACPDRPVQS